jgi:hypothetical protein
MQFDRGTKLHDITSLIAAAVEIGSHLLELVNCFEIPSETVISITQRTHYFTFAL